MSLIQRLKSFGGIGVLLGLFGAFTFSIGSLLAKLLNANIKMNPFLIAAMRQSFLLFLAGPQVAYYKASYTATKADWPLLMARSLFGGISVTLFIVAITYLPLGDAGVIVATSPAFTTLLGRLIMKEKCYVTDVPMIAVTFCGVAFILRPAIVFDHLPEAFQSASSKHDEIATRDRLIGCALALLASLSQAGMYLCIRKLRRVNYATITFFYSVASGPVLFAIVFAIGAFKMPPCYVDRTMMLAMSFTAAIGQLAQALAAKFVTAGIVSLTRSSETVFNFVWQFLFLGGHINPFSIVGCVLVLSTMIFLSFRSIMAEKYAKIDEKSRPRLVNCLLSGLC